MLILQLSLLSASCGLVPLPDVAPSRLDGDWRFERIESGDTAVPAEVISGLQLSISKGKMQLHGVPLQEAIEAELKVMPGNKLELIPRNGPEKGRASTGAYELDGDNLKLTFSSPDGKKFLWALKRKKPAE
jgi:uncharacterized protein (TIGR03067 family)